MSRRIAGAGHHDEPEAAGGDRLRSQSDYRMDLKAELEIRHLHEKIDHLISRQWQRLTEIQQMQLETVHEMTRISKGADS